MRAALVLLAACAPISSQTRTVDTVISRDHVRDAIDDPVIVASLQPEADSLVIEAREERRCRESEVEQVRLTHHVTRSADKLVLGAEVTLALVFGAAGGFLIWDNRAGNESRVLDSDVTPETGRAIGIATASVGGLALLAAVIDGVRARDRVEDGGMTTRKRPTRSTAIACGSEPAANIQIAAIATATEVPLGTTDARGRLAVTWEAFPALLVEGANPRPDARVLARRGERTWPLGNVSLASARRLMAERARSDAEAANAPERWEELASRFPDEHGAEATRRARELRVAAVRDSLANNDLVAARAQLAVLAERFKDDAEIAALGSELSEREATAAREELWKQAEDAVALAEARGPVDRFAAATAALAAAEASGADPRATSLRARLDAARTQRVKDALAAVKRAKRDVEAARTALADAEALAASDPDVIRARRSVDALEVEQLRSRARARAAAKDYAEAEQLLARALEIRTGDTALAKERERMAKLAAKQNAVATTVSPPPPAESPRDDATREPVASTPTPEPPSTSAPLPSVTTTSAPPTSAPVTAPPASVPTPSVATTVAKPADNTPIATTTDAPPGARATARYRLRAATARSPVDWLQLPRDCVGNYVGAQVTLTCASGTLTLVRTDLDVELTCNASSCARCRELQRGLVPRGRLEPSTDRCEETSP